MDAKGSEQKESVSKTDPKYCEKTYGEKFTHCKTDAGSDCCLIGDSPDSAGESTEGKNENPIDCVKNHGDKFEDCERDWGWDCCMKDDPLNLVGGNKSGQTVTVNKEPIDCTKIHGPRFQDCETKLGWDCCFVGDPLDDNESMPVYKGPPTCSEMMGPEFVDCGEGYGLDCCYVDDGVFKHDKEHGKQSGPIKDSGALKHFEAFYKKEERPSCTQQFGEQWTECGVGFGLDCCYIDDGILFHDANVDRAIRKQHNLDVLRGVVLLAVVAFVVINRLQVFFSKPSERSSPKSGKKVTLQDGEDDDDKGDSVELRPLI